ncbi:MAG: RluA family pseudouridine synthase, partial [Actinomycetota bacterium]
MTVRYEVLATLAGTRQDVVVAEAAGVSRARAGELIGAGRVRIGGRIERKSYRVAAGDVLEIDVAADEAQPIVPPEGVVVVYEDADLLVVHKPAGVVVHRAAGVRGGTLVDALLSTGRRLAALPGQDRPGILHRLDRDVSGLLVVAKNDAAYEALTDAMRRREIERRYLALVHGVPSADRGKIDAPIGRDPKHRTRMAVLPDGRSSVTWFQARERFGGSALLEVKLETGRTHQIRTHLASIGHPIVGDAAYGRDRTLDRRLGLGRPFLHAFRLSFAHPR